MENFLIYPKNAHNFKNANSSNFRSKFSDVSKLENFQIYPKEIKFPPSPFGLKIVNLTGPDSENSGIVEKVRKKEKFPIYPKYFLYYCKYSNSSNFGENFPISPNWKFFNLFEILHLIQMF